jgi:hypothetical protein
MPNWCSNRISFEGTEKAMQTFKKDVASIKDAHCLFTALTDIKSEWSYDVWINEFGTKWSVWMDDDIREAMEQFDYFNCETAWSPCTEFVQKVCKKYGVEGRIEYSEPKNDFGGVVEIDVNGDEVSREEMSYREYQYNYLGTDGFFEDFDNDVEEGLIESEEQIVKDYYYVNDDDMEEMLKTYREINRTEN